jgi:hypothetical protein
VRFWLGVIATALSVGAVEQRPQVLTETWVEQVTVEVESEPWRFEPLTRDLEEHAQCLIDVVAALDLELTVDHLFIVGDFADLQGGPCRMLE